MTSKSIFQRPLPVGALGSATAPLTPNRCHQWILHWCDTQDQTAQLCTVPHNLKVSLTSYDLYDVPERRESSAACTGPGANRKLKSFDELRFGRRSVCRSHLRKEPRFLQSLPLQWLDSRCKLHVRPRRTRKGCTNTACTPCRLKTQQRRPRDSL